MRKREREKEKKEGERVKEREREREREVRLRTSELRMAKAAAHNVRTSLKKTKKKSRKGQMTCYELAGYMAKNMEWLWLVGSLKL